MLTKIAQLSSDYSSKDSVPLGGSELSVEVFKQRTDEILAQMTSVYLSSVYLSLKSLCSLQVRVQILATLCSELFRRLQTTFSAPFPPPVPASFTHSLLDSLRLTPLCSTQPVSST